MNFDLLIKLAKLANNNPNENEANSAARRVCKLIEEGEYKFIAPISPISNDEFRGFDFGFGSGFSINFNPEEWLRDVMRQAQPGKKK